MNKTRNHSYFVFFMISIIAYFIMWFYEYGADIYGDGAGYYEYFVRSFVKHDLLDSGIIKYPVGTMILQLPFTLSTLIVQNCMGRDLQDGYSQAFKDAVFLSALFYFVLSSILLYKFLCKKYSSSSATLTVAGISLGTMLPVYICEMASYSHIYGYFLCTAFFVYISYYEERRNQKKSLLMDLLLGALLGGCIIIRNTNVVIGSAYLFYGVTSINGFKSRLKTIFSFRIIPQLAGASCIYMIQMIFWRVMSGGWVFNSYSDEHFNYIYDPQMIRVLFSDAKGLFIYCPVLIIAIIGMIAFRNDNQEYRIAQWVIFIFVTYVIAAWWCWWLGCGYGERMYCDVLCIFALPFCGFMDNLKSWRHSLMDDAYVGKYVAIRVIPIIIYSVIFVFVVLNLTWINGTRAMVINDNFGTWYELKNCFFERLIQ